MARLGGHHSERVSGADRGKEAATRREVTDKHRAKAVRLVLKDRLRTMIVFPRKVDDIP